ncbi:hypothetical protein CCAN11_1930014 [Capnocytophaga canimorsus]|uniref:Uncharacterized protein n=1 Tax=Capnocytophaga canimorsus TaxID=28188 RepID=A0A0B7IHC9_9FLAO|nr:hypothetical protein CCAN11_1930014 [Capnocytophaga canimorsus]
MKLKNYVLFLELVIFVNVVFAQNKSITLEDIWAKGMFYPEQISHLSAMKNTNQYTTLKFTTEKQVHSRLIYMISLHSKR